jgi:hypothetical protein
MALTTIRYSGLPGNSQSGANSGRRPGLPAYLEQVVYDERPRDPFDPGPYGSPGWYADKRTGRHRRGELPDNFGKLREDAWTSFLIDSDELYQAHFARPITLFEHWVRMWESLWAFLLRVLGVRVVAKSARPQSESPTIAAAPAPSEAVPPVKVEWRNVERTVRDRQQCVAVGVAKVNRPSPMSGIPSQGEHRVKPVSPFMAQWERHFDAAQAFREAVAL